MSLPLPMRFVLSAPDVADLPASPAEVAVVGRSNVGKSSLLNALARRKDLAKVSGKPGKTRLLNLFETEGGTLVDLPGYGYAKVSQSDRQAWERRMHRYLRERQPLALTLLLVDGEVGPTALDKEMLDWLRQHDVTFRVVATKHDKVKSSKRDRRKRDLAAGCQVLPGEVLWVSAEKGVGIDRLRALVRDTLAPPPRAAE
ncbi:ribosome biogenesis GTP-binding protein YihA/YsxC [Egicoccus sp. AB-alg6-2]|uniref:ribosome biogenesis GTP-binding protein YihA/YsxC n=1 Tax=Egicoccus sp. AB-alg6-2 TaxID=3242692 RepID=UPI00359E28D2